MNKLMGIEAEENEFQQLRDIFVVNYFLKRQVSFP